MDINIYLCIMNAYVNRELILTALRFKYPNSRYINSDYFSDILLKQYFNEKISSNRAFDLHEYLYMCFTLDIQSGEIDGFNQEFIYEDDIKYFKRPDDYLINIVSVITEYKRYITIKEICIT
jgi:hypothetical protein